jgi:8-oxo-dGTP pyrophosphatase MutT (NUDIX family)
MAVPVRDAATVMLVRDAPDGIEVFMLRRNASLVFVPGAYVFPGGAVDEADAAEGGDAFAVAAIRECFEEAGALLAYDRTGEFVDLRDPTTAERFNGYRHDVHGGRRTIHEVCAIEGLRLAVDALRPVSRWVTPPRAPRRFDTRFFVARAPVNQTFLHDDHETVASEWVRPKDALTRFGEGDIALILPTERSLELIARSSTVDELLVSLS